MHEIVDMIRKDKIIAIIRGAGKRESCSRGGSTGEGRDPLD